MTASGSGELFLANQAMLVHVLRLTTTRSTVERTATSSPSSRASTGTSRGSRAAPRGCSPAACSTSTLRGSGLVALLSDGEPLRLDVAEAADLRRPAGGDRLVRRRATNLKTDVQAKSLIGMGSGESIQLGFSGRAGCSSSPPRDGRSWRRADRTYSYSTVPEAHDRRALRHGDLEVLRRAHRQLARPCDRRPARPVAREPRTVVLGRSTGGGMHISPETGTGHSR